MVNETQAGRTTRRKYLLNLLPEIVANIRTLHYRPVLLYEDYVFDRHITNSDLNSFAMILL